ncbi:MAG TPA: alpha-L-fucosidase, partial [Chthonomonadales bacterium]|nr:alpha-L-fucosidase [Chthonomonadales bacterium]
WFDGGWEHNAQELHSSEVNRLIRMLQPGIMINDRNHEPQDYSTPEQTIPAGALPGGRLWETCMTINDTWGYAKNDTDWKSSTDLIHKLCDIAGKGGNFLLNVGPTSEGVFPDAINQRLADMGKWMKVNGACIYGTSKSPFRRPQFEGACTIKGKKLYLEVFRWPSAGLRISGLVTPVTRARALAGGAPLKVRYAPQAQTRQISEASVVVAGGPPVLTIQRPAELDPVATVVELTLAGPPSVVEPPNIVMPDRSGEIRLGAADADIHGSQAQLEQQGGQPNIGYWVNRSDTISWQLGAPRQSLYQLRLELACPADTAGATYHITLSRLVGSATAPISLSGTVPSTGGWNQFQTISLGDPIRLGPGEWKLTVTPDSMPHGALMNLRAVDLQPVR